MRATILTCAAACGALADVTIPAADYTIAYQGRVLRQPDQSVRFSWEGTQANFQIAGASTLSMSAYSTFAAASRFHVFVDSMLLALSTNVTISGGTATQYTLATGLDPSVQHNVSVWYITDPITLDWPYLVNSSVFMNSFNIDAGTFSAVPQRKRRLQIIGDSITAGNQIDHTTCQPDHAGTYGAKLCERFQANCTTLAISGKGLYENCCDNNVTMSTLFQYSVVGDPTTVYDNSAFVPDAVLLNLGTNDQNGWHNNNTWAQGFIDTYAAFLYNLTVIHGNPNLPIFCGVGPITHDYTSWVLAAMQQAAGQGVKSYFVNYTTTLDGCGHPGWIGHEQMYEIAEPIIAQTMGWD